METRRDTGMAAASGKVGLFQEKGEDPNHATGFLIYDPVYLGGGDPGTVALRQKNLVGFVYSPFRVADLLQGVGGERQTSLVDYTVYDQDFTAASHLHHTGEVLSGPAHEGIGHKPDASTALDVAGRKWRLAFRTPPSLHRHRLAHCRLPYLESDAAFSLMLFWVMSSQARSRLAAERAVAELSRSEAALRRSQAKLARLVDSNLIGVVIGDSQGNATEANDAFLSITGYTREDLREGKLTRSTVTVPEYADRDREALSRSAFGDPRTH